MLGRDEIRRLSCYFAVEKAVKLWIAVVGRKRLKAERCQQAVPHVIHNFFTGLSTGLYAGRRRKKLVTLWPKTINKYMLRNNFISSYNSVKRQMQLFKDFPKLNEKAFYCEGDFFQRQ